jgi:drug/metabolite transporter superfamily protein YnfA
MYFLSFCVQRSFFVYGGIYIIRILFFKVLIVVKVRIKEDKKIFFDTSTNAVPALINARNNSN